MNKNRLVYGFLDWDGERWQQGRHHQEPEKLAWLEANRDELPVPGIQIGESVNFVWAHGAIHRGVVRRISLHEGYTWGEGSCYRMPYEIDWNGHVRLLADNDVIGHVLKTVSGEPFVQVRR